MRKKIMMVVLGAGCLTQALAYAAEETAVQAGSAQAYSINYFIWTVVIAMMGLSLAAVFCGLAQGKAISHAVENIARQPEAAPKIQMVLMIGLAFIESLVLYVLFIGIILLFVNPFSKYFVQ